MTQKEIYIRNRERDLKRFKNKVLELTEKVKTRKEAVRKKFLPELKKLDSKISPAGRKLLRLKKADVVQWEGRRKKLRDAVSEIKIMLEELSIKIK